MTIIFPDKWQTASQSTPGPSLAGFAPNRPGGNSGRKRPGHGRNCLVLPKPTSLESQNPEEGRGPSRSHSSLPSKPRALALRQARPASEGFPGPLGDLSLPPSVHQAACQRGVARLARAALAGVLGLGVGRAVCWLLPAPWGKAQWGGGGDEGGLITLGSSSSGAPAASQRKLPSPAPLGSLRPTLGDLDDEARGQKSTS